ncbi:VCBS repeat-containing protein [Marinobacterium sediminicola]|uniref:VCBS repeat-containing protein n=2 Tax=Marinobacterium sediminicola TaxID=518898 RepID=A0ABY1S3C0_9GAMM|nr:VCBS repeat-containing protein [Marinobacterium sediminicola]
MDSGGVKFIPNENFNGEVTVKFFVDDRSVSGLSYMLRPEEWWHYDLANHYPESFYELTFRVTPVNDAPELLVTADAGASIAMDEAASGVSSSGKISFNDVDFDYASGDTLSLQRSSSNVVWSGGSLDSVQAAHLLSGFTTTLPTSATAAGTANWQYNMQGADLDFLAEGETLTLSYEISATDLAGASTSKFLTLTITGTNDAPILALEAADGITEVEGDSSGQALSDSGVVVFNDLDTTDRIDITFASDGAVDWSGATAEEPLSGAINDALIAGFSIPETIDALPGSSLEWSFDVASINLDFLAAGETLTFGYTVTATDSADATATQQVTFTITGTNDAPTISVEAAEALSEVVGDSSAQPLTESGTVEFADLDTTDLIDITFVSNEDIDWSGGTLDTDLAAALVAGLSIPTTSSAAAPGTIAWSYSVTDANLDFLAKGETITFSYTFTLTDEQGVESTDTLRVTLTGTNDAPTLSVEAAEAITEVAGDSSTQVLSDSGVVNFGDLDTNDRIDITFADNGDISWSGATTAEPLDTGVAAALINGFTIADTLNAEAPGSVDWSYDVAGIDLDFLASGETLTFSYTVTATDSADVPVTQQVLFTITGTNDAPTITVEAAEALSEVAGDSSAQALTETGVVAFRDLDTTDLVDITFASNSDMAWSGGTLDAALVTLLESGFSIATTQDAAAPSSVDWRYNVTGADLDFLAKGETLTFSYTVTARDSQDAAADAVITFTINGSNDTPTIAVTAAEPFSEAVDAAAQSLVQIGVVSFTDHDLNNTQQITFSVNQDPVWRRNDNSVVDGLDAGLASRLVAAFTTSGADLPHNGQVAWHYQLDAADLDFLNAGDTVTFSYTVTVEDTDGATASEVVTITLIGSNDAPEATSVQLTDDETITLMSSDYRLDVSPLFSDKDSVLSREDLDFTITGLPKGLIYDPETGVIEGKPSEPGRFTVTLTATDSEGASVTRSFVLTVNAMVQEEANPGGDTPPPPQPPSNDPGTVSDEGGGELPEGVIDEGGTGDPTDGSGYMDDGGDDSGTEIDTSGSGVESESDGDTGGSTGGDEIIIMAEPGALVVQSVNTDGNTTTRASVDVQVNSDGQVLFSDDQQQAFSTVSLQVVGIDRVAAGEVLVVVQDTSLDANSQFYTASLGNGEALPEWITLDPATGSVKLIEPPAGEQEVVIRITAIGSDGTVRVLELKLDLPQLFNPQTGDNLSDNNALQLKESGFRPFAEQLENELANRDQYGTRLMAMLKSA